MNRETVKLSSYPSLLSLVVASASRFPLPPVEYDFEETRKCTSSRYSHFLSDISHNFCKSGDYDHEGIPRYEGNTRMIP